MVDQNTKNICHLIRQAFKRVQKLLSLSDAQCQELAIAFTFMRRVDCLIEQYIEACSVFYTENREKLNDKMLDKKLSELSGGYPFYNVSGYNMKGMLNSGLSVEVAVMSYIQGFSPNVRQILTDMRFSENVAVMMRQSKYLVDLFELFSDLNLSLSGFSNKRFIDLITTLASDGSRSSGLCPTPIGLSKLICECLFCKEVCEGIIYDDPFDEVSIYDPVCGTGSLLAYAGEKAKSLLCNDVYLIGQEISPFSCAVANGLILLTGDKNSFADDVNTLTIDNFEEKDSYEMEFRFVVGDLPLGLPWTPIKDRVEREHQKENGRFGKGLPSTNDSQFLFIQDIVSKMDSLGGRAAFITSGYVLNGGSVKSGESRIRRWLFEAGLVETIIALPAGILSPYTNIPVYLWILSCIDSDFNHDNAIWEQMEGKVRLIDAAKLVPSDNKFVLDDRFISSVLREYKSLKNTSATKIVSKDEFGFYELKIEEKGKKKETIKISLDTDIHEFIEKERKPYSKGEIIIDYGSVEKGYSVDFSQFFKLEESPISSLKEETNNLQMIVDAIASLRKEIDTLSSYCIDTPKTNTWQVIPLHAAVTLVQGNMKPQVVDQKYGHPLITVASLRGESTDEELYAKTTKAILVSSEDAIIIKTGANAGEIFKGVDGLLSPTLVAVRCLDESIITPKYLYYLLKGYEKSFRLLTKGAAMKNLDAKAVLGFKFPVPPVEEQLKLAAYLDDIVGKIDEVISVLGSTDNVFSSYRQTLIENVVHGRVIIK